MKTLRSGTKEIRELVDRASIVLAHYWPMSGFVHHNPIRNLEIYNFHEAVQIAERFIGGRGYLTNEQYRQLLKSGGIEYRHLDSAIHSIAQDDYVEIAGKKLSHFEVLRAHLLIGITAPYFESLAALIDRKHKINREYLALAQNPSLKAVPALADRKSSSTEIRQLATKLDPLSKPLDEKSKIGRDLTLLAWCDQKFHNDLQWLVDKEMIKWCEAFMDEGHASWQMPNREKGFYAAWKDLASQEWSPCGIKNSAKKIKSLPASAEEALMAHLEALAIPEELRQDYLSLELTALCGWTSFINWRAEHEDYEWQVAHPINLVQYLAVRLFYVRELVDKTVKAELGIEGKLDAIELFEQNKEPQNSASSREIVRLSSAWRLSVLAEAFQISVKDLADSSTEELQKILNWLDEFPESQHGPVWLEAHEAGYQEDLTQQIRDSISNYDAENQNSSRPNAQLMFCIDVRSEPFRRNLESVGNYGTIGFAGFFGIPMRARAFGQHHETDQLPAIVAPKYVVHEVVRENQKDQLERHNAGAGLLHTIHEMLRDMKFHVLTPYIMVESLGWLFGVQMFGRTLFPQTYRNYRKKVKNAVAPPVGTKMTADKDDECDLGLSSEDQAASIEAALKTMGLTENFGRLVVVSGHTSTSDNNPYEAALNCGACGGNSGKPNARLFAAMANKAHVREHLANNGIIVPEDTYFVGAVHDTTTDAVDLFDLEDLPDSHKEDVAQLKEDLKKAAAKTNYERCLRLPGIDKDPSAKQVANEIGRRAGDWSETRPEWGLASNAAFIIGNRTLTKHINLEGRAFLNSHDYRIDPTGALLEGILNGPMVVGQWINAEHYFSATDPEVYGSGSKIYHNVVGRIGIMSGPQSDLRTGLAWQSMMDGERVYHEPLRLFVIIEAPRERILDLVNRNSTLKQLCENEWIHLMAVDHDSNEKLYRYVAGKDWTAVDSISLETSKKTSTVP